MRVSVLIFVCFWHFATARITNEEVAGVKERNSHTKQYPNTKNHKRNGMICPDGVMKQGTCFLEPGASVEIQSQNYPSWAPNREFRTWEVKSVDGTPNLKLECDRFAVMKSPSCRRGYVKVSAGGRAGRRICDFKLPKPIENESEIRVKFESDFRARMRRIHCVISAQAPPSSTCQLIEKCGKTNTVKRTLFDEELEETWYSWAVSFENKQRSVTGSGTIISNNWVITSASSAKELDLTSTVSIPIEENVISNAIEEIVFHPVADIALIKVSADLLNGQTSPACLATIGFTYDNDYSLLTTVETSAGKSHDMQPMEMRTMPNTICSTITGHPISDDKLCAEKCIDESIEVSNVGTSGEAPINNLIASGTKGAPLVTKQNNDWTLIGIEDMHSQKTSADMTILYTRVSKYVPWIKEVANIC